MKYIALFALLASCSVQAVDVKKMAAMYGNSNDDDVSYKPSKPAAVKSAPAKPAAKPVVNKNDDEVDNKQPNGAAYKEIKEQSEKRIKKLEARIEDLKRTLKLDGNSDFRYFGAQNYPVGKKYLEAITAELPKVKDVLKKFQNELAKAKMTGYATFTVKQLADMRAKDKKKYDEEYALYKKAIDYAKDTADKNNQGWKD